MDNSTKVYMMRDSKDLFQLLIIIFIDYLYRIFILTPLSIIKNYSRHPLSITFLFLILFPIYFSVQFIRSIFSFSTKFTLKQQARFNFIRNLFFGSGVVASTNDGGSVIHDELNLRDHLHRRRQDNDDDDDNDEMQQWLERCSICFESKLDLCLDYCRDQFCLDCFQKYVSEVVKSSWGLSVTKIRCPVCRVFIPQSEWTKFVPKSIVDLYTKFNRPYRSFSKCCPQCETEVTPCDFSSNSYCGSISKSISIQIKDFFQKANTHDSLLCESLLPSLSYQHYLIKLFEKSEWTNSTLPDLHQQLMSTLLKSCQLVDQSNLAKSISKSILQLEMRPDTWRKLQFDHISIFSNINCPSCDTLFCLQCGHEDAHMNLTCEENMKRIIMQNELQQINNDFVQTIKWKLENSRNCPSCSIMINRDEGCNKVECTLCGFSFCWECKSTWSDGCGFFSCLAKTKIDSDEDEGFITSQVGDSSRTEWGVPNIDIIQSRLNNGL
ncbi:hypothetical protein BD770DRAFT_402679 [Pilaira anomala]|nr:hypothetical protein BD770DRAFT_402679 [Pilaira anomala]